MRVEVPSLDPIQRCWIRRIPVSIVCMDGGSHVYAILNPYGVGHRAPWSAVMLGLVAVDLVKAAVVRRTRRFLLVPRLAVELIGVTIMAVALGRTGGHLDALVLPGLPLALEAGIRLGRRGLVVPLAFGALALVVGPPGRTAVLQYESSFVLAALMGWGLSRYSRRREQDFLRDHARALEARLTAAWMAARNEVLTGAGSVVDQIQRTGALIELGHRTSTARRVTAERKQAMAEAVRERAAYLADVLLAWQSAHNRQPDLARVVLFDVAPDDGTVILTREQAQLVWSRLTDLHLRGPIRARLAAPSGRSPDVDRILEVGDDRVPIPATEDRSALLVNAAPVVVGLLALWTLGPVLYGMLSLPVALPFAVAALLLARRAHTLLLRSEGAAGQVWFEAAGLIATYAVVTGTTARSIGELGGNHLYPALLPIQFLLLLGALCWPWIDPRLRPAVVASAIALWLLTATTGAAWEAPRLFAAESLLAVYIFIPLASVGTDLRRTSDARRAALARDDAVRLAEVRAEATGAVLDELREGREVLGCELATHGPELDAELRREAERRLQEIDAGLRRLLPSAPSP